MTAQTPGHAAYEEYIAALGWVTAVRWQDADDAYRAAWEAAAQAVLNQAFPGLRDQLDKARATNGELARQLTAPTDLRSGIRQLLADVTESAEATRPSRKTETEDEFATALRRLLEAP